VKRELGLRRRRQARLDENPLGPSPKAILAAHAVLGQVNRYADPQATELRRRCRATSPFRSKAS
jgi:histidinol-phosphate/aromatic aminotransferase/cobyric acid decarboxylase-like protein